MTARSDDEGAHTVIWRKVLCRFLLARRRAHGQITHRTNTGACASLRGWHQTGNRWSLDRRSPSWRRACEVYEASSTREVGVSISKNLNTGTDCAEKTVLLCASTSWCDGHPPGGEPQQFPSLVACFPTYPCDKSVESQGLVHERMEQ